MKRNFICLAALLLLMSCGSKQAKSPDKAEAPIGASDAAQGYTYSKVLDKKIRIFEEGARVLSATDPQATMAGYVVFPSDSSKAEVFLSVPMVRPYGMWRTTIPTCWKSVVTNGW